MKNRWRIVWSGTALLAVLAFPGSVSAQNGQDCLPELDPDCSAEVRLLAGQSMDVGSIVIQRSTDEVCVTYLLSEESLVDGMLIYETHLAIGDELVDIAQTQGNKWGTNPIPGQFPYGESFYEGVPCVSFCLLLSDLGLVDVETLYIAAHAVVGIVDDSIEYMMETAWGEGSRFNERGNWGMYIMFEPCWFEIVPSYVGYEDNPSNCDFDYNDFGMDFMGVETYVGDVLRTIELQFCARVNRAENLHDIHILRSLKGNYTYSLVRDHVAMGTETVGGVDIPGSGDFDVVLFDTERWPNDASQVLDQIVTITITMDVGNDLNKLGDFGPAPRFDLSDRFSLYDPYMVNRSLGMIESHMTNVRLAKPPLPAGIYEVPCVLVIPECDWPHPDEAVTITGPYPMFYDYYSTQLPAYKYWWDLP
ncbi:hypothetical protein G0Q06_07115 [Puniceicoccales bacterium CK1056]|uniref:DUF4842 domain-containing protein n=1 Tax=Oceanipulchritudo coccoides TaxID=2706888 RepID=A0A6B2M1I6_9BACT|nr:hypothetical protein [Oceanipulchritudo coccoides]NDV62212.1 hypothetical protein [Oceanipulchritudo coccoides]